MKKKILYIEISTAHTEIIKSFVDAMTPEHDVHLLIHSQSLKRVQNLSSKIQITGMEEKNYLSQILNVKKEFKPDLILLNSAQGRKVRDLCLRLLFDRTPIVGIHHNPENLYKSFTQKIIHWKIKKYIVLADFIKDFIKTKVTNKKVQIASFYPLSYHQGLRFGIEGKDKYILIPGVLEQDRRDYLGFLDMVQRHHSKIDPKLKFVLLGNSKNHDGPKIVEKINSAQLQSRFVLFDHYVEDEIMLGYVEKCLAIMPLMHPGTRWFEKYFETKISGAYNLAFAFEKRLLMHEVFTGKTEFETHGSFYDAESLPSVLQKLDSLPPIKKLKKFDFSFQKERLLAFLK